ncbi:MAG TPA: diacylglycerol kinase family protein [Dictyobacter sp.]|jgi:diacylglycerol kinase|nr:diacylglycerol kinase family protein [Dictyobacter sp.]
MKQPPVQPSQLPSSPDAPPPVEVGKDDNEWKRFVAGFKYALQGLWYTLRTQRNARVHALITLLAIIAGIILQISALEFAILFVAIITVFVAEMFNTVIEICVDLASPEYHPLAKIAKDVAAGAVLVNAILAIIIGFFIFLPHILHLL